MGKEPDNFLPAMPQQDGPQAGPSWGNPRWPLTGEESDLTAALDPTELALAIACLLYTSPSPRD